MTMEFNVPGFSGMTSTVVLYNRSDGCSTLPLRNRKLEKW